MVWVSPNYNHNRSPTQINQKNTISSPLNRLEHIHQGGGLMERVEGGGGGLSRNTTLKEGLLDKGGGLIQLLMCV